YGRDHINLLSNVADLARTLIEVGRIGEARECLNRIAKLLTGHPDHAKEYGVAIALAIAAADRKQGKPIEAHRRLAQLLDGSLTGEKLGHVLVAMGELELEQGNSASAASRFEAARVAYRAAARGPDEI